MDAPPLEAALDALGRGSAAVILENDLLRRKSPAGVRGALGAASRIAVIDHLMNGTAELAELVLPAGTFAESDGTFVNYEGRAQRFFQVYPPGDDILESWRWLRDAMVEVGRSEANEWRGLDEVICAAAAAMPVFEGIQKAAPPAGFRASGTRIPRQPHRFSGRTSMFANITVHEPAPAPDADSPLAFSMEGHAYQSPPEALPFVWAPNWNSGRAFVKYHEEVSAPDAFPKVLLLSKQNGAGGPAPQPPRAFERRDGEWLFVPMFHVFGSEELTHSAPAIMSLAPAPYVAFPPSAGFAQGDLLQVSVDGASMRLPAVVIPSLPEGVAGLPQGLPQTGGIELPAWGTVVRAQ
jgi:NADH-quinone oxidoreductase subunit G